MIEKVYWVLELAIHRGRFEDLQTLVAAMVEATQRNEVGALITSGQSVMIDRSATSMNATKTPTPP